VPAIHNAIPKVHFSCRQAIRCNLLLHKPS
jgi:hypothetical protein